MIAVAWADWKDFRQNIALLIWGMAGIGMAAALVAGGLRPEYPALVIPAMIFALGWALGTQRWNARRAWDWTSESRTSALDYLLGKGLGLVLVGGTTLLFLSPLVGLLAVVSGVTVSALLWTLAWTVDMGLWALVVALLVTQGPGVIWQFFGLVALILALVETSAVPAFQAASPLMQLWYLYQTGEGGAGAPALLAHGILLIGLGALTILAYRLNPRFH